MTSDSNEQIRELLETRTRAFGRRDAATVAAGYDDDTGHAVPRSEL